VSVNEAFYLRPARIAQPAQAGFVMFQAASLDAGESNADTKVRVCPKSEMHPLRTAPFPISQNKTMQKAIKISYCYRIFRETSGIVITKLNKQAYHERK
jgi:hypothetical protein